MKKIKLITIIIFFGLLFFYIQIKLFNIKIPFKTKALEVNIELNLRLQGDYSRYNKQPIFTKVAIYTPYQKVREFDNLQLIQKNLQAENNNNIFTTTFTLNNIDLNQIYSFFIKPNKYLGRVIPAKILKEGNNAFNLSNDYFFAGDFYPIDGKIAASELSFIIKNLWSKDSFESDINSDGITDTQDYSLILYSLKKNLEEDTVYLLPTPTQTPTPTPTPTSTPTLTVTITPTPSPMLTQRPTPTPTPMPTPTSTPTLTPIPTTSATNNLTYCQLMRNDLPNAKMRYPNGTTSLPQTTNKICAWDKPYYYSLPYRNPNCRVTQAMIDKAYNRMRTYYPNYYQKTKIKEEWQIVQELSIKYNFNPLFVISLWIEESAAGGATQAQQLGCLYRLNKDDTYTYLSSDSNICEQMECLFGSWAVVPDNFARWACPYQHGFSNWHNNDCLKVTTFTRIIEFWYNYMSDNGALLGPDCQIKRYSPSNSQCP